MGGARLRHGWQFVVTGRVLARAAADHTRPALMCEAAPDTEGLVLLLLLLAVLLAVLLGAAIDQCALLIRL